MRLHPLHCLFEVVLVGDGTLESLCARGMPLLDVHATTAAAAAVVLRVRNARCDPWIKRACVVLSARSVSQNTMHCCRMLSVIQLPFKHVAR